MIEQTVLVAVIIAAVEAIKRTNKINETYLPFVAIVIGVGLNCLANEFTFPFFFEGLIASLVASGFYDNVKVPARAIYGEIKK